MSVAAVQQQLKMSPVRDLRQPFLLSAGSVRHLVTTLVFAENLVLLDTAQRAGGSF